MIKDEHVDRAFVWFKLQPQLLLQVVHKRRSAFVCWASEGPYASVLTHCEPCSGGSDTGTKMTDVSEKNWSTLVPKMEQKRTASVLGIGQELKSARGKQGQNPQSRIGAINLWDRLYAEDPAPSAILKDACVARFFRRAQIAVELMHLAAGN